MNEPDEIVAARELLDDADPIAYHRMMAGLARPAQSSLLQDLAYNPSLAEHSPSCVRVEPDEGEVETTHLYGRAAYPDFDRLLVSAFSDPANDHLLNELYHRLILDGSNVAMVTNHGDIVDIALVLASLLISMADPKRRFGVLDEHVTFAELARHSNVLVSRMVSTRQAFSIPAVKVLQSFTRVWFSVPQTASRRRAKIDADLSKANNIVMRHELREVLESGGQLLAMAASGSQDISLASNLAHRVRATWRQRRGVEPEGETLHLQPLYDGTIGLMLACDYVLPVATSLDPSHQACVIGGLTRVREPADCHAVMDWIASAHQNATGIATIYHHHEDPLLSQVRDLLRS